MSILSTFLNFFEEIFRPMDKVPNTGLLLDDLTYQEALPRHDLFGSKAIGASPMDWSPYCPTFRSQGVTNMCTAFGGTNIASILEKKENGTNTLFSPCELFVRSGGQLYGNYVSKTVVAMQDAVVLEADVPTPTLNWTQGFLDWLRQTAKASVQAVARGKQYRIKGVTQVSTDRVSLEKALQDSPIGMVIGIGPGYYKDIVQPPQSYSAYHFVVLVNIEADGTKVYFDSVNFQAGFNGFRRMAPNYPILFAYGYIDLPDNWQVTQTSAMGFQNALNHYGKPRNLLQEQEVAKVLTRTSLANPTLASLFGKYFTVLVNAVMYGGYSTMDILNALTSEHRGQGLIFDFNKPRK